MVSWQSVKAVRELHRLHTTENITGDQALTQQCKYDLRWQWQHHTVGWGTAPDRFTVQLSSVCKLVATLSTQRWTILVGIMYTVEP